MRIPMLQVMEEDRSTRGITLNEENWTVLCRMFFPAKPAGSLVPPDADYPVQVNYSFRPSLAQLQHCVAKLSPYKTPGEDGIPNVVIKEAFELIAEYLLHIYKAVFTLGT